MNKDLKEIPIIPPELLEVLPTGQIVIFIGAGVSCLLGYPDWNTLANRILKRLAEDKNVKSFTWADIDAIHGLTPRHKISIAIDKWKETNKEDVSSLLEKALTETLKENKASKTNIYNLLSSISTRFITTNYEACLSDTPVNDMDLEEKPLEEARVSKERTKRKIYWKKNDFTDEKLIDQNTVFHLHGILGQDNSLVLTTRDYVEHYRDRTVVDFLEHLFDNYNVIFIGYGLAEEEILEYVIRKKNISNEIKHFRLFPLFSHQKRLYSHLSKYYQDQCSVQLIPYIIDKKGHYQLEDVLKKWLPILKEKIQPLRFNQKTKLILDEVLK